MNDNSEEVEKALIKKAVGFETEEVVEEYSCDGKEQETLVKKKKTIKQFPPDLSAIKILLSYYGTKTFEELEKLSDEELIEERDRLLKEISDEKSLNQKDEEEM